MAAERRNFGRPGSASCTGNDKRHRDSSGWEKRREPNGADWHEADPSCDLGSPLTGMADLHYFRQGVTSMVLLPLSDEAWQRVRHLFPYDPNPRFGRPARNPREILDAILWVTLQDERWHRLPAHFPPPQTCYIKWLQWRRAGLMCKVFRDLGIQDQVSMDRRPRSSPTKPK